MIHENGINNPGNNDRTLTLVQVVLLSLSSGPNLYCFPMYILHRLGINIVIVPMHVLLSISLCT